jgi:hypothetical protein
MPQSMSAKLAAVSPAAADAWASHGHPPPPQPHAPPPPYQQPPHQQPPHQQPPYQQPPHQQPPHQQPPHQQPPYPPPHQQPPYPPPYPPPYAAAPPRDRRGWKTVLAIILIVLIVGGAAIAGVLVARHGGGRRSFLSCPGGVCPRFPIDKLGNLEVLDSAFGRVRLFIPPGALREPTELSVRPAPPATPVPYLADPTTPRAPAVIGSILELGPDGQVFDQPLRVEVPVDVAKLPTGADVAVLTWDDDSAERLAPIAFDREAGNVTVLVHHFSRLAAIVDPGPAAIFAVGPLPCPPPTRVQEKCPWTPDGYAIGECTTGFCFDGGPQGFLACKQRDVPPGAARGENMNPYCPAGTPIHDRCTGVLTACEPPPAPAPPPSPPPPSP